MATAAADSDPSLCVDAASRPSMPEWVLLDRFVFRRYEPAYSLATDATSARGRTSNGATFRVSFRLAAPPATSRLHLHWPDYAVPRDGGVFEIVGAHRNAVLFSQISSGDPLAEHGFRHDLFVFRASGTGKPSLTLLPPFTDRLYDGGDFDDLLPVALHERIPVLEDLKGVGMLCSEQKLAVAHLSISTPDYYDPDSDSMEASAQIYIFYSSVMKWQLRCLWVHCDSEEDMHKLHRWSVSRVISFRGYLCWVDYRVGILFYNVFQECYQVTFVGLPVDYQARIEYHARFDEMTYMDMYRTISVVESEAGQILKFVDVTPLNGYVICPRSDGCKVTCWTLVITEENKMLWQKDAVIEQDVLCLNTFIPHPHGPLTFPVVSIDKPHIIYFVVGEIGFSVKKLWLVTVDTLRGIVHSVVPYLNGKEDLSGDDGDMAETKGYCLDPFLPTEISKFLNLSSTRS